MPTTSPPILVWTPGGGVPVGPISNPPVYSQAGTTPLIEGQAYVDVVFGSTQTTDEWVLVECIVVNEIDGEDALNLWPGIITDKTTAGFRIYLNGMPDSGNYYLHWAVSGVNIVPSAASTYYLSGPATGDPGEAVTFTVRLPPSTTVAASVTVTPDDGGAGGIISPTSVVLTMSSASATFTYTAASYGDTTISTTNSSTLIDPASVTLNVTAPTYTLTGPSTGATGAPSTDFTVELSGAVIGTVTVTPSSGGGGGSFTPVTVALTTGAPSATFTYTPASGGDKTISVTNDGGLSNPSSIIYTSVVPFDPTVIAGLKGWWKADALVLADGANVASWTDSSGNGYDLTSGTATYKTGIVNSKPVVRFNGTSDNKYRAGIDIGVSQPNTWFIVVKKTANPAQCIPVFTSNSQVVGLINTGELYISITSAVMDGTDHSGAFHVITAIFSGGNATGYVDGVNTIPSGSVGAAGVGVANMMVNAGAGTPFYAGDVAECLLYNSALGTTDRTNVENFLKTKYGL